MNSGVRSAIQRAIPLALPLGLLVIAVAMVASQAARPLAVLNMWRPWGEIGMLATVMTAIILTGGIDLSVGSIIALCSVSFGLLWQSDWPVGLAATGAVLVGLAAGTLNGALVAIGIAPLVATLATLALYAGAAMVLAQGERVFGLPESFTELGQGSFFGVPNQLAYFLLAWLGAWLVVHHTRFGRQLYAIGDNRLAAQFAAVPLRRVEWTLYAASGAMAAVVAIIYTAANGAAVPNAGAGLELQAIACVVVGGTRVNGGWGGLGHTLLGVCVLSLLDIGLQFVARQIYLPWSDRPWQFNADARLLVIGILVIAIAIWNQRVRAAR